MSYLAAMWGRTTVVPGAPEEELESIEAELEKAKAFAGPTLLRAHGRTWETCADDHLD